MIYYISDLHLADGGKTIKKCHRPFKDVEEYEKVLLRNWSHVVSADDHVYILGDLFCSQNADIGSFLERLTGKLHLIEGNHDHSWLREEFYAYFESIEKMQVISDAGRIVHLCHYPLLSWYKSEYGSFHVFGHIHNERKQEYRALVSLRAYNACVDVNNFRPVTLDEMIKTKEIKT